MYDFYPYHIKGQCGACVQGYLETYLGWDLSIRHETSQGHMHAAGNLMSLM